MGFFDTLLRGAVGFATGGPVGAGLGLLSGVTGGGGSSGPAPATTSTAATSPLQQVLQKEAWLHGFQQVMGAGMNGPAAQNFDVPVLIGGQLPQAEVRIVPL